MLRSRSRSVAPTLCLLLAVAVVGVGCAEPEATPEATGPETVTVMVDLPDATTEQMNAAADVLRQRLMALDLDVAEVGWDDASVEIIVPASDEELVRLAVEPVGELEFRPVLEMIDPSTPTVTTPLADRTPEEGITASSQDGTVYVLGPSALSTAAVESATASKSSGGQWVVSPVFREGPDGIDAFNTLADSCYQSTPACPAMVDGHGMAAILLDGVVLTAPTIQVDRFERDQIQISGTFDADGANAVAAALDGGAANVPWTVRG